MTQNFVVFYKDVVMIHKFDYKKSSKYEIGKNCSSS